MFFAHSVQADGHGEAVLLEERRVVLGQKRAVGGDRETQGDAQARRTIAA